MIVLMNWWYPYSIASIESALACGYQVCVVVSNKDDYPLMKYSNRVLFVEDDMPRHSKAAHTLTRFDHLPKLLISANEPILITDADIIFQYKLNIPTWADIALWRTSPRLMSEIDGYAKNNKFPIWWAEMACQTMAEAMVIAPTQIGHDFAQRIKLYANSLRKDGFGDRWGVDQVAIHVAERRLENAKIFKLDSSMVATNSNAAMWFPHPYQRDDPNSEWSLHAKQY